MNFCSLGDRSDSQWHSRASAAGDVLEGLCERQQHPSLQGLHRIHRPNQHRAGRSVDDLHERLITLFLKWLQKKNIYVHKYTYSIIFRD